MKVTSEFTFFFGEEDFLSNWHKSPFVENGIQFATNEHYMMYKKAVLFGDSNIASLILSAKHPRIAKEMGRRVAGFDPAAWAVVCDRVVFEGAMLKFTSTETLLKQILSTNSTTLVEASPYDKIWGIGLSSSDPRALDPDKWLGQNKLGKVLTDVRDAIAKEMTR